MQNAKGILALVLVGAAAQATAPLPPVPGARESGRTRIAQPLELSPGSGDEEARLAGTSFARTYYERDGAPPARPLLSAYRDALFAAGWKIVDASQVTADPAPAETVSLSAHYTASGQDVYARLTQEPGGAVYLDVADVGAEDWAADLARDCRLRIYSIHFQHDRPDIRLPESEPALRKLAEVLTRPSAPPVEIQGHMDNIGESGAKLREALSRGRPRMVVEWLTTEGGVPPPVVTARGYGRSRPIADNDSDWGRALNRRIEVACRR